MQEEEDYAYVRFFDGKTADESENVVYIEATKEDSYKYRNSLVDFGVDLETYAKGKMVSLTRKENGILEYLLLNMGRPVSQEELMEHVWDASVDSFSGAIRVHMSSLRRKLKAVLGYDPILNKVGEGYKIREESDR